MVAGSNPARGASKINHLSKYLGSGEKPCVGTVWANALPCHVRGHPRRSYPPEERFIAMPIKPAARLSMCWPVCFCRHKLQTRKRPPHDSRKAARACLVWGLQMSPADRRQRMGGLAWGVKSAPTEAALPTKRVLDLAQHRESAIGVVAVIPVLIGHECGGQYACRCPTEFAHKGGLTSAAVARPSTNSLPDLFSADRGGRTQNIGKCVFPRRQVAAPELNMPRNGGKSAARLVP
jgi:hypothetical protein